MSATPVSKYFDIPKLYYFESDNAFSGSRDQTFNYKITPGDKLKAQVWHGLICSEKANIEHEKDFPMEQSGYDEMIKWLEERYEEQLKN